jgi:23S rRNA (uracil1939-C5)-methyltransferase
VISVSIDTIAAGGDGVGRLPDGRTVFVPRTAPGDVAEIAVVDEKPRYARGQISRLLRASPLRVEPECPHYVADQCGGCQLQHLSLEGQRTAKASIVRETLRRIGDVRAELPPLTPSPLGWRYRTKITLAARSNVIGLRQESHPDGVFPLADCLITDQRLMDLWKVVAVRRELLPADLATLVLRVDREGGLHLVVVGSGQAWKAEPLAAILGDGVSLWWQLGGARGHMTKSDPGSFPATAFEQVNPSLAPTIRADAIDALGGVGGKTVWDLYGGVGDTARALAARGARVWSVDADREAIAWARRHEDGITYLAARAEDVLSQLPRPDLVVVNPPRTGLDRRVSQYFGRWSAPGRRLVYISCDPATLARDLSRMKSLRPVLFRAYDLFPQTAHVEVLGVLVGEEKA